MVLVMSVSVWPGSIALTQIKYSAHSRAKLFVLWTTAALEVEYSMWLGITRSPSVEAILMIEPPRPESARR